MMGPLKPKEPSWWNSVRNSDLSNTSDEQMEIWRADFKIFEEKYREYAAERSKLHSEIVDLARDLWGLGSKQVMYIQREKPVSHLVWGFDIIERKRRDDIKAKADAEKQKELDISKDKLVAEAILWLQGKGKTLGEEKIPLGVGGRRERMQPIRLRQGSERRGGRREQREVDVIERRSFGPRLDLPAQRQRREVVVLRERRDIEHVQPVPDALRDAQVRLAVLLRHDWERRDAHSVAQRQVGAPLQGVAPIVGKDQLQDASRQRRVRWRGERRARVEDGASRRLHRERCGEYY